MGDPDAQYELGSRMRVELYNVASKGNQRSFIYCQNQQTRGHADAAIAYGSLLLRGYGREDPFNDLSEKFDELEVSGEGITNGSSDTAINFDAYEDIPVEASGSDVPPAVDTFADIDLGDALNRNIKRCKYVRPTPIQRHAIPIAVAGRDLMACAQTGSGKTAAFCFPIISGILKNQGMVLGRWNQVAYPTALILSPTRELASQIQDEAKKFAYETSIKIAVVYGGAPIMQQFSVWD
ncbi:DEAD-box ATP-dependent RNA helicase 37-like [Tripterygium wilfordii]|uniref:DEAD-box ATP-dependent RNA helicase 37-like n=1 Tax=Tripterygium wilfordii TaxID=458696 RepID=A0A7J7DU13_TRIWF|nr:DEAD-box ATP-dependent RNA helicase 37-like [Tripterygium wilfordii]